MPAQTPPELQLTYQPDFRDLFEASAQLRLRRYPARQRLRLNLVNIGSMLAGGMLAGGGGVLIARLLPAIPVWASTGALFLALVLFYVKLLAPWLLAQSAAIVHEAHPPGPMDFTSDAAGLRWRSDEIDFRLHWSGVEAVFCTSRGIAFMSGVIALLLPFAAFASRADAQAFLEQALAAIPPDAAARSRADRSVMAFLAA